MGSAGIGDKPTHSQASRLGHLQRLTLQVVFKNVISLWRLQSGAKEYNSIPRDVMRNRVEKRLWIGQVLGQHRGYNALAFSVTVSVAVQRVLHSEPDTARVSGNSQQAIG